MAKFVINLKTYLDLFVSTAEVIRERTLETKEVIQVPKIHKYQDNQKWFELNHNKLYEWLTKKNIEYKIDHSQVYLEKELGTASPIIIHLEINGEENISKFSQKFKYPKLLGKTTIEYEILETIDEKETTIVTQSDIVSLNLDKINSIINQ